MKKRLLSIFLVLTLLLSACTNKTTTNEPNHIVLGPSGDNSANDNSDTGNGNNNNTSDDNGSTDSGSDNSGTNSDNSNNGNSGNDGSNNGNGGSNNGGSSSGTNGNDSTDTPSGDNGCKHADANADDVCDLCQLSVLVYIDFYAINDLHGKIADGDSHPGVDELTTYLKNTALTNDYQFILSSGDMWQGSSESNLTNGLLTTEWMNYLGITSMTLGNHEYDWGESLIEQNDAIAEFPFLAINIYDRDTNQLVNYCQPSVVVTAGNIKIGIIGAMGDCYNSIAQDRVQDVYFKTGKELTALVKAEADRLRNEEGVDIIVYSIHDGYGSSRGDYPISVSASELSSYYDIELSNGYVDLVFEGHTHQKYILKDQYGVYHLQHRGDNSGGISHAELAINEVTGQIRTTDTNLVSTSQYQNLEDDSIVADLLEKYDEELSGAYEVLGNNSAYRNSNFLCNLVAELYLEAGIEKWGSEYNIVLGGGSINARKPYNIPAGPVTYADIQPIFPFDNEIVLCAISGQTLKNRFFNNEDYVYALSSYGMSIKDNIDPNATYYVIMDTWSSDYKYNKATTIDRYGEGIYARDLLADYIARGGLDD